ncbi:MAG: hypothetical protein IJS32_06440, partial [Kiritimatiellae bacterium]|nr:hypothetical protein [Kiritimatiellia bacterium]
ELIEPHVRGDPMSPLRWTTKSLRKLSEEMAAKGFAVSHETVRTLLLEEGYTMQSCKRSHEGGAKPQTSKPRILHAPTSSGTASCRWENPRPKAAPHLVTCHCSLVCPEGRCGILPRRGGWGAAGMREGCGREENGRHRSVWTCGRMSDGGVCGGYKR